MQNIQVIISFLLYSIFLPSLALFLFSPAFTQNSYNRYVNYRALDITYSAKPDRSDTLCLRGLRRAEDDIVEGRKAFCIPTGPYFIGMRNLEPLKKLVVSKGFEVVWDSVGLKGEPEPEKCYCARMIRYGLEKYGKSFRWDMFKTADSLFADSIFKTDGIVGNWHCDERSVRLNRPGDVFYNYPVTDEDSLCGDYGFVDVGYVIGHQGEVDDFYIKQDLRYNDIDSTCQQHIFEFTEKQLLADNIQPGKLHGRTVRTRSMVRVYLKRKE